MAMYEATVTLNIDPFEAESYEEATLKIVDYLDTINGILDAHIEHHTPDSGLEELTWESFDYNVEESTPTKPSGV